MPNFSHYLPTLEWPNILKSAIQFGGTKPYQASEIFRGEDYNTKVDVYAFGILMFEVLNDSFAYPDLYSGKMNDFVFSNKIVNEKYRPEFTCPVKNSLKQLADKSWSDNPDERPSFGEIFEMLSNSEKTNENGENYILEDVDNAELQYYFDDIAEIVDPVE